MAQGDGQWDYDGMVSLSSDYIEAMATQLGILPSAISFEVTEGADGISLIWEVTGGEDTISQIQESTFSSEFQDTLLSNPSIASSMGVGMVVVTEEPCAVLGCPPGCVTRDQDENGCGGYCDCESTITSFCV